MLNTANSTFEITISPEERYFVKKQLFFPELAVPHQINVITQNTQSKTSFSVSLGPVIFLVEQNLPENPKNDMRKTKVISYQLSSIHELSSFSTGTTILLYEIIMEF